MIKNKKLLFAAWACEDKSYTTYQTWYGPLNRLFKNILLFDPQKNSYVYGQDAMNRKFLELIKREKPEYIFLSKHDTIPPADVKKRLATLKKIRSTSSGPVNRRVFALSVYDWDSLENVKKILHTLMSKKHA